MLEMIRDNVKYKMIKRKEYADDDTDTCCTLEWKRMGADYSQEGGYKN